MGQKAAGWEKSALNVLKLSSLRELPWPNRLCYQLALLDSWKTHRGAPAPAFRGAKLWEHGSGAPEMQFCDLVFWDAV